MSGRSCPALTASWGELCCSYGGFLGFLVSCFGASDFAFMLTELDVLLLELLSEWGGRGR